MSDELPRITAEDVRAILAVQEKGFLRSEIESRLPGPILVRTLQRWLVKLEKDGHITRKGVGKATRYFTLREEADRPDGQSEHEYIPLSDNAAEVRSLIRRPTVQKQPVGYRPEFLLSYTPGETWYLSEVTRKKLARLGSTFKDEQPAGTYARQIFDRFLIDLSWASSRLEGNTYSKLDTRLLLEFGQKAEGKDVIETLMILNHKQAIELLVEDAPDLAYNRYTVFSLHALLAHNLLADPLDEGRIRRQIVGISGTVFTPLSIPHQLEEYFDLILEKTSAIPDPFEQAFFFMVHIPYLQPFSDVNKRVSRVGANISLVKANMCPLSFIDVPRKSYIDGLLGVYESNRVELLREVFVWAYERSASQYKIIKDSVVEPDPFRLRYRKELGETVRRIVSGQGPPSRKSVAEVGFQGVKDEDRDMFVEMVLDELLDLHEGKIVRYGLRLSEFNAWLEKYKRF